MFDIDGREIQDPHRLKRLFLGCTEALQCAGGKEKNLSLGGESWTSVGVGE